jgi:hypothetical protein
MLEGGSLKGRENVRNKDLVVYSYEQRRIEATFKGDQDSLQSCRADDDDGGVWKCLIFLQ